MKLLNTHRFETSMYFELFYLTMEYQFSFEEHTKGKLTMIPEGLHGYFARHPQTYTQMTKEINDAITK